MTETKSEAFHRLATQRLERIEDAVRIFSNLSGPSYEWTQAEVEAYLDRIGTAVATAYARFQENSKSWIAKTTVEPAPDPGPGPTPRELQMLAIWAEPRNDEGALLEMLAMQREVIEHLQKELTP